MRQAVGEIVIISPTRGTLKGKVTHAGNGAAISGANVTFKVSGMDNSEAMVGITNMLGDYTMSAIANTLEVTVVANGFVTQTKTVGVPENGTVTVDFSMAPAM